MKTAPKTSRGLGDKDQRILDAAKILFSRFGLKKTSIEEIAQHAGLGKGTVYLYFKSKDEIFSVLANGFAADYDKALNEALSIPSSPIEKLRSFIETRVGYWDRCFKEYGATAEAVLEAEATSVVEGIRKEYGGSHLKIIQDIVQEGVDKGEFQVKNPEFTALAIYHILDALSRPWSVDSGPLSAEAKIDSCVSLLLNGLSSRKN